MSKGVNFRADDQNNTLLHHAARYGNLNVVKQLILDGADINARNNKSRTPLFAALEVYENEEVIEYLLQKSAHVSHISAEGETPLCYSMGRFFAEDYVKTLCKYGALENLTMETKVATLRIAACRNHIEVVKGLLAKGIDLKSEAYLSRHNKLLLINNICRNADEVMLELILEHMGDKNIYNEPKGDFSNLFSSSNNSVKMVSLLFEYGLNIKQLLDNLDAYIVVQMGSNWRTKPVQNVIEAIAQRDINALIERVHASQLIFNTHLEEKVEEQMTNMTPDNLKKWKAMRLKALLN
jgi:ankyrin repeat protein